MLRSQCCKMRLFSVCTDFFCSFILQVIKTMSSINDEILLFCRIQGLNSCMPFHNKSLTTDNLKCYPRLSDTFFQTQNFQHKTDV